jgi:hypothetical protein
VLKRKKVSLLKKNTMDPCSFLYAIGVGLLLFAMLYFIRRLVNAFQRNNEDESKNTEKLGWDFDQTDRNFVRASLAASLLTLLICWFTNHDKEKTYADFGSAEQFSGRPRVAGREDDFPLETPSFETPSDLNMKDIVTGPGSDDLLNTWGGNAGDRALAGEQQLLNALETLGDGNLGAGRDIPLISPTFNEINVITPENY